MSEPVDTPSGASSLAAKPSIAHWAWRFLACNPCYLVSAALLLYGFYRISIDPGFLHTEAAQLNFDLGSLQFYELLLVVTAVWLARRAAWYDATLLVWLENGFVFVPFILISQAGLIDQRLVWILCFAAALLILARFSGLKRLIAPLNLPGRALGLGVFLLAANVAWPVVYRILHESKVGTKPDWGSAYLVNEYTWIVLLPALCLLANFLPHPRSAGKLLPQRGWLPAAFFLLWLAATGVHLYCLGYVYDFELRPELVAPAGFALLWTLRRRVADFAPRLNVLGRQLLLVAPLLVTLLAVGQPSKEVFLLLTIWNIALYGICYWQHEEKLALHLMLVSVGALAGGLPQDWLDRLPGAITREKCIGAATVFYLVLLALRSIDPKWGLAGAAGLFALVLAGVSGPQGYPAASQVSLVFLLLHSLRWEEGKHQGATVLRVLAAMAWVGLAIAWTHMGGAPWILLAGGSVSLAVCLAARWLTGQWGSRMVPLAALLVLLSGPGQAGAGRLSSIPSGLIAVMASFALFGCGTIAAVTRHRWQPTVSPTSSAGHPGPGAGEPPEPGEAS